MTAEAIIEAAPVTHTSTGKTIYPQLNQLLLGHENVRTITSGADFDAGIKELADLIHSQGLLQALSVTDNGDGTFGVEAGGRRFRALCYNVQIGRLTPDAIIECKLYEKERAAEISLAENSGREDLHPADEFAAYAKLRAQGLTDSQIASRFGVSLLTVQRRMKLAEVSPRFVQMFREGKIDWDQIAALTVEESHARQEAVWDSLPQWQRSPYHLKDALTGEEVESTAKLARFVGLEAYTAAGGKVREDLFSVKGEFWFQDRELLNRLCKERMAAVEEAERAAGWSWVEVVDSLHASGYYDCTRERVKTVMTDEEAEDLAVLEQHIEAAMERQRELSEAISAVLKGDDDADEYGEDDEDDEREEPEEGRVLRKESAALAEDITAMRELAGLCRDVATEWTPKQLAACGVMILVDQNGQLVVHRGLRRPVDKKALVAELKAAGKPIPKTLQGVVKEKAAYSERLMLDMTAHRTAALKAALIDNAHVALALVVHRLSVAASPSNYEESPLKLNLNVMSASALGDKASEFSESPAAQAIEQAEQRWGDRLPGGDFTHTTLAWFVRQDDETLLELLAYFSALGLDALHGRERTQYETTDALVDALDLDLADWWKPTPGTYLNGVSKAQLIEAVTEQCGEEAAKVMASHKKGEAVAYAAGKLAGSRWLPVPLRRKQQTPQ